MKRARGFTLIELLVVIAIIGILAAMLLVSLSGARAKGRDARRKSDLREMKVALESYYGDQKPEKYVDSPTAVTINGTTDALSAAILAGGYMKAVPTDPQNVGNFVYTYQSLNSDADYKMTATLENTKDPDGNNGAAAGYVVTND